MTHSQYDHAVLAAARELGWTKRQRRQFLHTQRHALQRLFPFTAQGQAQVKAEMLRWLQRRRRSQQAARFVFCGNDDNARNHFIIEARRALRKAATHLDEPSQKVSDWRLKSRRR